MDTQALHSYARRIAALMDDIDAIKEDIKVVEAEARTVCNVNVKVLRKWIAAERKDKVADIICEIGDLTEYGQILGHMESFQGVRENSGDSLEAVKEAPPHDPDTGEIIAGPGNLPASAAEPSPSPDAECADQTAPTVNASPAPEPSGPVIALANSDDAAPFTLPDIPASLRRTAGA